jgi:hypothetical protein
MAYNPYKDVNEIHWLKKQYMSAQDDEQRKWAEQEANKIYEQMTSIGQGDLCIYYIT